VLILICLITGIPGFAKDYTSFNYLKVISKYPGKFENVLHILAAYVDNMTSLFMVAFMLTIS